MTIALPKLTDVELAADDKHYPTLLNMTCSTITKECFCEILTVEP